MRVALIDYGAGNLHSLVKAIATAGASAFIEPEPARALDADAVVLPGVGSFGCAAARLRESRELLRRALVRGTPCLGICLGMQLLFEESEEGIGAGLAVLDGRVRRLRAARLPHMGWNTVEACETRLFDGVEQPYAWYANSYVVEAAAAEDVIAWTEYERDRFPAAVRRGRIWGVQFHPEKSGAAGLRVIRNFLAETAA